MKSTRPAQRATPIGGILGRGLSRARSTCKMCRFGNYVRIMSRRYSKFSSQIRIILPLGVFAPIWTPAPAAGKPPRRMI
jgi:hypothetical protein